MLNVHFKSFVCWLKTSECWWLCRLFYTIAFVSKYCASFFRWTHWFCPFNLAANCFPFRIASSKLHLHPQCTSGILCWQLSGSLIYLYQTSWEQNRNQIMHVEQSVMEKSCVCSNWPVDDYYLVIVFESIRVQFCRWTIDFLEVWAEQHKHIRFIREDFNDCLFFSHLWLSWATAGLYNQLYHNTWRFARFRIICTIFKK